MGVFRALFGLLTPAEALQAAFSEDRHRQAMDIFYGPGGDGWWLGQTGLRLRDLGRTR